MTAGTASGRDGGFTLVELMLVVVIVGILTSISIIAYVSTTSVATRGVCLSNQAALMRQVAVYASSGDGAPAAVSDLDGHFRAGEAPFHCPTSGIALYSYDASDGSYSVSCPVHGSP